MNNIKNLLSFTFIALLISIVNTQCSADDGRNKHEFEKFVSARRDKLYGDNGELRFISFNIPGLHLNEDNMQFIQSNPWRLPNEFEIRDALESISQMGGKVVRIYTFSVRGKNDPDGAIRHVLAPGEFNEEAFKVLDRVLQIANEKGIRIIIPFVNNWKWWGGIKEYAAFRGKSKTEFWTDPQIRADFKKTINFIINRKNTFTGIKYADDKAILAWQIGNELEAPQQWTSEIAEYIQNLDTNHLVMDGSHVRVVPDWAISNTDIDIVTTHQYWVGVEKRVNQIIESREKTHNKKPYIVGEFGFLPTDEIKQILDTVIKNDVSGALIWSLRYHNTDGGFYWHSEPLGEDFYKAYHWPGFDSGKEYDERNVLRLMRKKAYQIRGVDVPELKKPSSPVLMKIENHSLISWKGSTGAASYIVERSQSPDSGWKQIACGISDAAVQYRPLFNDTSAEVGKTYYYRIIACNEIGQSPPSNISGPVKIFFQSLIDEFADDSKISEMNGELSFENRQARKFKEDIHRLKGGKSSYIVYELSENINSWKIYAFFPRPESNLLSFLSDNNKNIMEFYTSCDGKNYKSVPVQAESHFSGKGSYGYYEPVLFKGVPFTNDAKYLKIKYGSKAQLGRVEILYGTKSYQSGHKEFPVAFIKGFSWGWTGWRGQYLGDKPEASVKKLADTNTNWMCLSFAGQMEKPNEPEIYYSDNNPEMVTDQEILRAINLARQNGLKVILKPVVNVRDGTWRAWIKFNKNGKKDIQKWEKWWSDFEDFLLHYARIAEQTNCEMLCLGCEMESTEGFEYKWRNLIAKVRRIYSGVLTYNANHGCPDKIKWWDTVDIMSVSAYYPVGTDDVNLALKDDISKIPDSEITVEKLKERWQPYKKELKEVSKKWDKPIFFIEIGVCSAKGFSAAPWTHPKEKVAYDGQGQARFYRAALETFWDEPWFMGFAWWAWRPNLYPVEKAEGHTGFCIYGKPAESVIRDWYNKNR